LVALLKAGEVDLATDLWELWQDYHPEFEQTLDELQELADA
jgi:ABC-type phosphate/phosphonate transport system substrate-binding protein